MSASVTKKSSKLSLWLILALSVAPFAGAYIAYYFWQPSGQINYGELIEAAPLSPPPLALADGRPFSLADLRGKWLLVTLDRGACDAYCQEKLYYLRQLRLAQGKEMERIERVWLILDDKAPDPEVVRAYAGTWFVRAQGAGFEQRFPAPAAVQDHIYVIDPLGNLILRYPREPDPQGIKKDLQRLLRASRIG